MSRNASFSKAFMATFFLFSALLLTGTVSAADEMDRTVAVTGVGTVQVQPDTAYINFNINYMVEGTAIQAQDKNKEIIDALLSELSSEGVKADDLIPIWFNIYPQYNQPLMPEGEQMESPLMQPQPPTGYNVDQQIQIETHNIDAVDDIITRALSVQNITPSGVNYALENADQYLDEAREKAAADARSKAAKLSGVFKFTVGKLVNISESTFYGDYGHGGGGYYGGSSSGGLGLPPQDIEVRMDLYVTFEIMENSR